MSEFKSFAKLYETWKRGQILVLRCTDDNDDPAIKTMFYSSRFSAVVTITGSFTGNDADDQADIAFAKFDEDTAIKMAETMDAMSGGDE